MVILMALGETLMEGEEALRMVPVVEIPTASLPTAAEILMEMAEVLMAEILEIPMVKTISDQI